jgi:hypothetical protein
MFNSQQRKYIFVFSAASRPALEPTQSPIYWVKGYRGPPFPVLKRPGRESGHSPSSSAEANNGEGIPHYPVRNHGVLLIYLSTRMTLTFTAELKMTDQYQS